MLLVPFLPEWTVIAPDVEMRAACVAPYLPCQDSSKDQLVQLSRVDIPDDDKKSGVDSRLRAGLS